LAQEPEQDCPGKDGNSQTMVVMLHTKPKAQSGMTVSLRGGGPAGTTQRCPRAAYCLVAQLTDGTPVGVTVVFDDGVAVGVAVAVAVELVCALMATMNVNTSSKTAQNFKLLMTV